MKPRKKLEYYNFPIQLLHGFMLNNLKPLENILAYTIYKYTNEWDHIESNIIPIERVLEFMELDPESEYLNNLFFQGETLFNSIPPGSPKAGIRVSVFWDYWKNHQSKTKYELICLVAHLALKSIIAGSPVKKIYYAYWFSRMDGHAETVSRNQLSPTIAEFFTPSKRSKIRDLLQLSWGLNYITSNKNKNKNKNNEEEEEEEEDLKFRGLLVSYKLNHIQLYEYALSLKEKSRIKDMKQKKKDELQKYLRNKKNRGT